MKHVNVLPVLGINFGYHDSSICLITKDSKIYAEQEERFSRIKFDRSFPAESLSWLHTLGLMRDRIIVAIPDDNNLKRRRLIHQLLASNLTRMNSVPLEFYKRILFLSNKEIESIVTSNLKDYSLEIEFVQFKHHESHAAATFFSSPFEEAAILVMDGVGERTCTSISFGKTNMISKVEDVDFPNSLGLFYAAFSYYCGFRINSGEFKFMGLAPYGNPKFANIIRERYLRSDSDGRYEVNSKSLGLSSLTGLKMNILEDDFKMPRRSFDSPITQFHADLASSVQWVFQETVLRIAKRALRITGSKNLCIGGGVALNCVSNGFISEKLYPNKIWVFSASSDAGNAFGSACLGVVKSNNLLNSNEPFRPDTNLSKLGREFSQAQCESYIKSLKLPYQTVPKIKSTKILATQIANGKIIGIFSGRSEFGPRALGNRSILADPRIKQGQIHLNEKIKFRESFRPFAPMVLEEYVNQWFENDEESLFMQKTFKVKNFKINMVENSEGYDQPISISSALNKISSPIPSVTHLDGSARVQTVLKSDPGISRQILEDFYRITSCPVLINTSFNVRGEPIVGTPQDAIRCFMTTGIDTLYLEGIIVEKKNIPIETLHEWSSVQRDD